MYFIDFAGVIIHELSHQLRSPISAVSNDLQYIHKLEPKLEANRTLEALNRTTSTLLEFENQFQQIKDLVEKKDKEGFIKLIYHHINQYKLDLSNHSLKEKETLSSYMREAVNKENFIFTLLDLACLDFNILVSEILKNYVEQ